MRVIHVITHPSGGGAEKIVSELHHASLKAGRDTHVVYLCVKPKRYGWANDQTHFLGLKNPRNPLAILRLRSLLMRLSKRRVDCIVHAHLTWPFFYVPLATLFSKPRLVFTEHNTNNRRRRFHYWRYVEYLFYSRYQKVFCISAGSYQSLRAWLPAKALDQLFAVVRNGVQLFRLRDSTRANNLSFKLLTVGSLTAQKGLDVAIRALAHSALSSFTYTIVGDGPDRSRLKALAKRLGVHERVWFEGWADDVESFFLDADLCVIPSRWEGFGLVAVEALSTGLPIVASDVPGLSEVISGCVAARTFRANDPQSLAVVLSTFVHELSDGLSVAREARARAEMFSFERMHNEYWRQYELICELVV